MANGGIYDQLGGGFARYSTDEDWHIPHFEKMLYDNAQLVQLYAEAYQLTKDPLYKSIVYQTLGMIRRTFTSAPRRVLFVTGCGQRRQRRKILQLDKRGSG